MKMTFLGTGTPSPSLKRQSAGLLLEIDDRIVVLDHGGGAHQTLLRAGYRPDQVTDLILTHLHSDHVLDVPRLVLGRWDQNSTLPPLRVFGPQGVDLFFERLFGPHGAFSPDITARTHHPASLAIFAARGGIGTRPPPRFEITTLQPKDRFTLGTLQVEVGKAQHFEPYLSCLGYRFHAPSGDVVITGDTGFNADVIAFAKGCRLMVAMCQYLHNTPLPPEARHTAASHLEVAEMAAQAGAKTLILTHISEQFDDILLRAEATRQMQAIFNGHVIWAEDGQSLLPATDTPQGRFD